MRLSTLREPEQVTFNRHWGIYVVALSKLRFSFAWFGFFVGFKNFLIVAKIEINGKITIFLRSCKLFLMVFPKL